MDRNMSNKDWWRSDRAERFLTTVNEEIDEPLGDLDSLRYISGYVAMLEEDLHLVQEVQGLWVMHMLEEKRYLSATIARALNTKSGPVAVTRIKSKYGDVFERVKRGEPTDSSDLVDATIELAEKIADDPEMPERLRDVHRRKLVLLHSMRARLYGKP